jgi:hypothetical protein
MDQPETNKYFIFILFIIAIDLHFVVHLLIMIYSPDKLMLVVEKFNWIACFITDDVMGNELERLNLFTFVCEFVLLLLRLLLPGG